MGSWEGVVSPRPEVGPTSEVGPTPEVGLTHQMGLSGTGVLFTLGEKPVQIRYSLGPGTSAVIYFGVPSSSTSSFRLKKEFKCHAMIFCGHMVIGLEIFLVVFTQEDTSLWDFPGLQFCPQQLGKRNVFRIKVLKIFTCHISSQANMGGPLLGLPLQCRLKGAGPAKARSWSRETDLKTKGMCRKPNNWWADSPRSGKKRLREERRLSLTGPAHSVSVDHSSASQDAVLVESLDA